MNARPGPGAGFTIIEVMIFLAVSGLMFVLAINAMSGKQQQTEFETGVDTLRSELNQSLSSVNDGNYLELNNVNCQAPVSGLPTFTASGNPDGSCTIIGEVIAFNNSSYTVFPAIGRNYVSGSSDQISTDLSEAMPVISAGAGYNQTTSLPFGLAISPSSTATIAPSPGLGAFGLFSFTSFEGNSVSGGAVGGLSSGSEHVEIFAIPLSSTNYTSAQTASEVSAGLTNCNTNDVCLGKGSAVINPTSGITFCVNSGTNNYSALFSMGGGNSPNSATDKIYSQVGCL